MPDQSELLWNRCPFSRRLKFNLIISLDCYFLRDEKLFGAIIESNEWICMRDFVFVGADVSGRSINVERNERSSSIDRQRPYTCTRRNTYLKWCKCSTRDSYAAEAEAVCSSVLLDSAALRQLAPPYADKADGVKSRGISCWNRPVSGIRHLWSRSGVANYFYSPPNPTQPPSIGQFDLSSSHKVKSHRMIEGMRRSRRPKTFWPQSFLSRRTFALSPWLWLRLRLWL